MRAFRNLFGVLGLWLPMAASAGEALVARWDAPRTVKLDLFYFEPGFSQWGSDFKQPLLEQWTVVLACTPSGPRREACTFVDGIWYGFVKDGTTVLESRHLPAPGALEFEWTERGRLSAWDVQGDRQAFADVIGNAVLEARYVRREVSLSADERRERGLAAEGFLTRALGGTLEWEMPKKPDATTWKPAFAPRALLRYIQGTTNSALRTTFRPNGRELEVTGTISDGDQTTVLGRARFDPELGRVVSGWYETHTTSNVPVEGPTRTLLMFVPWQAGDPTTPSELTEPRLVE